VREAFNLEKWRDGGYGEKAKVVCRHPSRRLVSFIANPTGGFDAKVILNFHVGADSRVSTSSADENGRVYRNADCDADLMVEIPEPKTGKCWILKGVGSLEGKGPYFYAQEIKPVFNPAYWEVFEAEWKEIIK
jgi:hypothetical protein